MKKLKSNIVIPKNINNKGKISFKDKCMLLNKLVIFSTYFVLIHKIITKNPDIEPISNKICWLKLCPIEKTKIILA